ncbi:probable inactive poly [ADP-ribose] polymerase SRO2 [Gastrolobium bilobum]|uniref:probable inactive poly [ADP-ribose] polymerase SRO2 n=1 Tax=Gastrolobium bilobum TaxID=150636 RepID=UPI002AB1B234|nr:probable inactive poly [ADP-ribose] polymerase SRO2 [Gastrolobium bilobum]
MDPTFPQNGFGASVLSTSEDSVWDHATNQDSVVSDSESGVSGTRVVHQHSPTLFLETLGEGDVVHDLIKRRFLSGLGLLGTKTEVVAIHRNACSSVVSQARVQCFHVYSRAMAKLRHGNANVKYAWYGSRGEKDIRDVISHGFGHAHGHKLSLSPDDSPLESVKNCVVGEDGVRHLLLCRVILGRTELVLPGTQQCNPSSEDYDSGVDGFSTPNNYIVWSSKMNTHVLPAYVVSFRVPSLKGIEKSEEEPLRPSSPWIPFPTLISVLSNVLSQPDIALIYKFLKDHREKKISRGELVQKVRQTAGDKLLSAVIKSYRAKKKPESFMQTKSKNGSRITRRRID